MSMASKIRAIKNWRRYYAHNGVDYRYMDADAHGLSMESLKAKGRDRPAIADPPFPDRYCYAYQQAAEVACLGSRKKRDVISLRMTMTVSSVWRSAHSDLAEH